MAESNPAENNRSFIPRSEFMTIVANASKGTASVKYGRAFLGSKYTLRLELDGKLDDQTLVRVYYIRGDRKIAMAEAYSGQVLDFTTEATYKAFELGTPSKSLCCEIFVYGNEAVIAHGMMTVEWSPSIAVDGYGRGVDVQGAPGVPYIPGNYYTIVVTGEDQCTGVTSSWTEIYQTLTHPTTGEVICVKMPYTVESLKGEKGDPGEGLADMWATVEKTNDTAYRKTYNAKLFSDACTLSTSQFSVDTGIYDVHLDMGGADNDGLVLQLQRKFQANGASSIVTDSITVPFDMIAWKATMQDLEGNVVGYKEYIGVDVNDHAYVADVSTLFGLQCACMGLSTNDCGSTFLNLELTEVSGEVFCSSVLLPGMSGCGSNWQNTALSVDVNDTYLLFSLTQNCGAIGVSSNVTSSISRDTLSSFLGGGVTPSGQYVSSIDYCLATDGSVSTGYLDISYGDGTSQTIPYGYGGGGSNGVSSIGHCIVTCGDISTGYLEVSYDNGCIDQIPFGYGAESGNLPICSIALSTNSSGYVNGIVIWDKAGSSFGACIQ